LADPAPEIEHLLAAARSGTPEALGEALEACRGYLLTIAQRELDPKLQPKGGASDLVQDTFLKAHLHFDRFQGTRDGELRAWLRELLLNNLRDFRRLYAGSIKRQVDRETPLDCGVKGPESQGLAADVPSPSGLAMRDEEAMRLEEVLTRLPDDYRQVLELRYRNGMDFDEIAGQMNRSQNAVRKLWSRAVLRLKQEWDVTP
jgi:RNA polymerase sigma-70 factor (ECF subfamily)